MLDHDLSARLRDDRSKLIDLECTFRFGLSRLRINHCQRPSIEEVHIAIDLPLAHSTGNYRRLFSMLVGNNDVESGRVFTKMERYRRAQQAFGLLVKPHKGP